MAGVKLTLITFIFIFGAFCIFNNLAAKKKFVIKDGRCKKPLPGPPGYFTIVQVRWFYNITSDKCSKYIAFGTDDECEKIVQNRFITKIGCEIACKGIYPYGLNAYP
ncbi:uncharacterized protein LOC129608518 [Condylostylus longicornis]|uniref:uncharacterized protein LOC129608518 n=1 Tax=Condylostylus longicornis TaxID=2530218 RepID=UPI00244DA8CB|nr:uncharacterized protein LOC129608518 [Condylostylus longicornis]